MLKRCMVFTMAVFLSAAHYSSAQAAIIDITSMNQFTQTALQSSKPVVVKFHATWCPSCKKMKPIFEKLEKSHADKYVFAMVDIDKTADVTKAQNLGGIPTFIFYKNGKEVGRIPGEVSQSEFEKEMKSALGA